MKTFLIAIALMLFAVPRAFAEDTKAPLQLRSKAAIATVAPHADAPFMSPTGEAASEPMFPRAETRAERSHSACDSDRDFCYDADNGHIVYKPARKLMPDIPGLRAENISIKRDRLVFKYSF